MQASSMQGAFSNLIRQSQTGAVNVGDIQQLLKIVHKPVTPRRGGKTAISGLRAQRISDAVAISTRPTKDGLEHILTALRDLSFRLLRMGYFVRGGLVRGKLVHEENAVFGPALLDAYHPSLPRVELDKLNQPDVRRLKPGAYLVGIDFLGSKQFRSAQWCISFVRETKSAGGPSLMSNFGRAAAVEISQIRCGLAPPVPSFLRAICSIPSFGIAKLAAAPLAWRYQQKYQQSGSAAVGLCLDFQSVATVFRGNPESNWRLKLLLSLQFFP